MELRECYERLGGDFDAVLAHLRTEARVEKFSYWLNFLSLEVHLSTECS